MSVADEGFDTRLERLRKAADVLAKLPTAELQADAFRYLIGDPKVAPAHETGTMDETKDSGRTRKGGAGASGEADDASDADRGSNGKKTTTRKSKPGTVNPDKDVDLAPGGKQSFVSFVAEKKPQSHIEKYVISVYWLLEIAEAPPATIAQIVTCYHAAAWTLPTDVKNMASQAGRKELDNSKGLNDIRLASLGRNLVLALPKKDSK